MTGFINAHTHLYSALMPFGLPFPSPAPPTFIEVLRQFWWRLDRALDRDMLRASARYYVADALLHGTHTLIDHHESPNLVEGSLDILADACQEFGMRAVVCYGATERNDGRAEGRRGLAECVRFIRANTRPLVRGAIGLHAAFTVSDDTIREAGDLCRETGSVLHVHVAEDACDVQDSQARGYAGVVDRLHRLGALVPGSIFAHGVHLTAAEVRQVASCGCWIVQNPRSNEGNRVGYPAALGASPLVALGTDGYPSDMAVECEAGCRLATAHGERADVVAARLEAGSRLAAERFGWRDDPIELTQGSDGKVERMTIAGRIVVDGGRLAAAEFDAVRAEAVEQAARLSARM